MSSSLDAATNEDAAFRAALDTGRFTIRRCAGCGTTDFPPAAGCWRCGSPEYAWIEVPAGCEAVVYTWTRCHRSFLEFADDTPYVVVVAELSEFPGVRVLARYAHDEVAIGDRVCLVVTGATEDAVGSYYWEPA